RRARQVVRDVARQAECRVRVWLAERGADALAPPPDLDAAKDRVELPSLHAQRVGDVLEDARAGERPPRIADAVCEAISAACAPRSDTARATIASAGARPARDGANVGPATPPPCG